MRRFYFCTLLFVAVIFFPALSALASFDDRFTDATMRIDYARIGDAKNETIVVDKIYRYGTWAGSTNNLIDTFNNGRTYVYVSDANTGALIFSKGFDSLFAEYQATDDAGKGIKKSFSESILIPNPKSKVLLKFFNRDRRHNLVKIFETVIDPADVQIIEETIPRDGIRVVKSRTSGNAHEKVDIVILGEGYTKNEFAKFKKDLKTFTNIFFAQKPYSSNKDKFNIYGVFKASEESGTDEPTAGIFKNTALNSSFNTLGSERYLMTEDNKAMRDLAANVPYDAIYIMVNHKRYGGGGIYNQFCTFTTDNQWKEYLFTHEFGHSFAGLGDEYYTSEVALNDFYPKGVEPSESNITALLDKKNLKWKELAAEGIAIPTPWEKAEYDMMDLAWQAKRRAMVKNIDALKKAKAIDTEIDAAQSEYDVKDREHNEEIGVQLGKSKFAGKIGAFEGAGYASKGLYRPSPDCIMFSKGKKPFCPVCANAIEKVIAYFGK